MVSVKLIRNLGNQTNFSLYLTGDYFSPDLSVTLQSGVVYHLSVQDGKFLLEEQGNRTEIAAPLLLIPKTYDLHHVIRINRHPYLGAIEFKIEDQSLIRPVNQLPLEDYLKGVVPSEVSPDWELEALKAQTLAARTYAVSHLKQEMDDTTMFQVYSGFYWFPKTTEAVEATKGQIISYHNHLIEAVYSASNGGITESNDHVWGGSRASYLPIKRDPFDPILPWQFEFHRTQINLETINWEDPNWWENLKEREPDVMKNIKDWLNQHGYIGDIKILSIPTFEILEKLDSSHRSEEGSITIEFINRLPEGTILFQQVKFKDVPLSHIRPIFGSNRWKSYLINSLTDDQDVYTIKGNGNGHGVGMSQWGASIMAEKGKSYQEILQFYFPGTKIQQYQK